MKVNTEVEGMREVGEVICLKACLGRHGEGKGGNAGREVGSVNEGGTPWHE